MDVFYDTLCWDALRRQKSDAKRDLREKMDHCRKTFFRGTSFIAVISILHLSSTAEKTFAVRPHFLLSIYIQGTLISRNFPNHSAFFWHAIHTDMVSSMKLRFLSGNFFSTTTLAFCYCVFSSISSDDLRITVQATKSLNKSKKSQ